MNNQTGNKTGDTWSGNCDLSRLTELLKVDWERKGEIEFEMFLYSTNNSNLLSEIERIREEERLPDKDLVIEFSKVAIIDKPDFERVARKIIEVEKSNQINVEEIDYLYDMYLEVSGVEWNLVVDSTKLAEKMIVEYPDAITRQRVAKALESHWDTKEFEIIYKTIGNGQYYSQEVKEALKAGGYPEEANAEDVEEFELENITVDFLKYANIVIDELYGGYQIEDIEDEISRLLPYDYARIYDCVDYNIYIFDTHEEVSTNIRKRKSFEAKAFETIQTELIQRIEPIYEQLKADNYLTDELISKVVDIPEDVSDELADEAVDEFLEETMPSANADYNGSVKRYVTENFSNEFLYGHCERKLDKDKIKSKLIDELLPELVNTHPYNYLGKSYWLTKLREVKDLKLLAKYNKTGDLAGFVETYAPDWEVDLTRH